MEFDDESDADLLVFMATKEDAAGSRAAWDAFYRRHVREVYARIRRAHGRQLGGDQGAEDLVVVTFQQAWSRAHQFAPQSSDRETQGQQVVAWLCRIAKNLFLNLLREQAKLPAQPLPEELPEPSVASGRLSPEESAVVAAVLSELNDRDRTVLLRSLDWWDFEAGRSRMPKGVAKGLADELEITTMYICQIRLRTFRRVESMLKERLQERTAT